MVTVVMIHFDTDQGLEDGIAVLNVVGGLQAVKLTREEIARIIYEQDPHVDGGEAIDGFQVTPTGAFTWEQAKAYDAEFDDTTDHSAGLTTFAYKCADALIARLQ